MRRRKQDAEKEEKDEYNGFAAWGGYMAAKKSKLLEQFKDAVVKDNIELSNLFTGISISVNGYTDPTAEGLKIIMGAHGGIYHHYHSSETTYMIASNLPDSKIKQLGPNFKVIKPEWVTDCVKEGKILDYSNYLLYTNRNQPKLKFELIQKKSDCPSPEMFSSDDENSTNTAKESNDSKTTQKTNSRCLDAKDPNFLSEFYSNSRLHHIATLGATFKQYICDLRDDHKFRFPERERFKSYLAGLGLSDGVPKNDKNKVLMHIDMDCFFVSVGVRNHPELKGLPLAVTHSKGGNEPGARAGVDRKAELDAYKQRIQDRSKMTSLTELGPKNMLLRLEGIENQSMSEIASCSYEARKMGVKNGMFMGAALKLCPNLQTIPYDFEGYKEVAYILYNTIAEYTLDIEAVSCDEMFVDISDLLQDTNSDVSKWAYYIRNLIRQRTGCPCSTGFGSNRLLARMATKTAKPNGKFHLLPENVDEYMLNIKVGDLPGVGFANSMKLESLGVKTCGELQEYSINKLRSEFGSKMGETLYNSCRGSDERPLVYEHLRKSVSAEVNYGIRFKTDADVDGFLRRIVKEVYLRLLDAGMKGKNFTLKYMVRAKDAPEESSKYMGHGICDCISKSSTLATATNDLDVISREIFSIARKMAVKPADLRGLGIQISRLERRNKNNQGALSKFLINMSSAKVEGAPTNVKEISPIKTNAVGGGNTVKRGRGRSRGRGGKTIERKTSNNGNLNKFLMGGSKNKNISTAFTKTTTNDIQQQVTTNSIAYSDIDMTVLAALPVEIQQEILAQYKEPINNAPAASSGAQSSPATTEKNIELKNSPAIAERNIKLKNSLTIAEINKLKNIPVLQRDENFFTEPVENCMFFGIDAKHIRKIIHDWVLSEKTPMTCDVQMLGQYFKQLALDKKINELYVMLIFLHNEISTTNKCEWHKSYLKIADLAQEGMLMSYKKKIKVCKTFNCGKMH